jgi:hypothetical protein
LARAVRWAGAMIVFFQRSRQYCLRTFREPPGHGHPAQWPAVVISELAHETGGAERLVRTLDGRGLGVHPPSSPQALVQQILREIELGWLVLEERMLERPALRARRVEVETNERETVEADWIEVEIVDPSGRPVPFVLVEIELPDGHTQRRMANENGWLRLEQIPSGECTVRLPHWDRSAWRRS